MATIYIPVEVPDSEVDKYLGRAVLGAQAQPGPTQPAAAPGFVRTESEFGYQTAPAPADPWASPATTAAPTAAPVQPAPTPMAGAATSTPQCAHGPMRYVAAGFSKSTGKPYKAFWGCAAPREVNPKCKSVPGQ